MSTSSPYTVTKIVRCRVRDLVSCFYACKFPLEEESEAAILSTNQVARETAGDQKPKIDQSRQKPKKGEASSSSRRRNLAKKKEIGETSSRWPSFADDDYIVFCFKDDGEVHVLPDKQSDPFAHAAAAASATTSSSRHVNLEYLIKLEDEAARASATMDKVSNEKGNGKEAVHTKTRFRSGEIKEVTETREEEVESGEGNEVSATSSDSNQSDAASTSSFAFPIIQGEWIGSPVQMPRPEVQKPKNVRIHCCRF